MTRSAKRKVILLVSWFLFLIVLVTSFFGLQKRVYHRIAEKDLIQQASAVKRQIVSIVESDTNVQVAAIEVIVAKLKALAFALEPYDDIKQAEALLDDYYYRADIKGLSVFDREGNLLYGRGEDEFAERFQTDEGLVAMMLDTKLYEIVEDIDTFDRNLVGSYLKIQDAEVGNSRYYWGIGDRWLISMTNDVYPSQQYVEKYLARNRMLKSIVIGRTGYIVAIDGENGNVLVSPDRDFEISTIKDLGIVTDDDITTTAALASLFDGPEEIVKMQILEKECYVYMFREQDVMILVVLPLHEIQEDVSMSTMVLVILVVFNSALVVMYAFFHTDDKDVVMEDRGGSGWNKAMSSKMKIIAALSVIGVFASSVYLEALSLYADTFSYTDAKVNAVVEILEDNDQTLNLLQAWNDHEAITRTNIAKTVLDHTDPGKVDWAYLSELAGNLGVEYIYKFDKDGNTVVTNAPFDRVTIGKDSPFHALLEGKSALTTAPETDSLSGLYLQKAGVSIRDENNHTDGIIMTAQNPDELALIRNNLGFQAVFDQLGLSEGSFVIAVRDEDMMIKFIACMDDQSLVTDFASFEYVGLKISEIGIKESLVRDNFNGNILLFNDTYFASIRRVENIYYIVMRPQMKLTFQNVVPALFTMAATLLFMVILLVVTSVRKRDAAPVAEPETETISDITKHSEIEFLSTLGHLLEKKKPYFEDRWPRDSKKWRDRTPEEKYSTVSQYLVVLALFGIYLHSRLSGTRSIWYYCVTGKWESGINLYSITSCFISICLLLIVKIIVHKILYLIAKAVGPRGETICHLTDNFSGYALVIIGFFLCLHHFGVNTTALSLTGGVAGVIFGIGCQNIVADILSGIIMAFGGEIHVGDFVSYNGKIGIVLSIGVRTTKLKWYGETTLVRNNEFKNVALLPSAEQRRVVASINIDLRESLDRVEKIIEKELPVMHDNLNAITERGVTGPNYKGVDSISQDCVTLSFYLFCMGMDYITMARAFNGELKRMCERNNINLAMHQIVVSEPEEYKKTGKK